eukprot:gene11472-34188_t
MDILASGAPVRAPEELRTQGTSLTLMTHLSLPPTDPSLQGGEVDPDPHQRTVVEVVAQLEAQWGAGLTRTQHHTHALRS